MISFSILELSLVLWRLRSWGALIPCFFLKPATSLLWRMSNSTFSDPSLLPMEHHQGLSAQSSEVCQKIFLFDYAVLPLTLVALILSTGHAQTLFIPTNPRSEGFPNTCTSHLLTFKQPAGLSSFQARLRQQTNKFSAHVSVRICTDQALQDSMPLDLS